MLRRFFMQYYHKTSLKPKFADNVFIAGDAATGASLVVRAMAGGRKAAQQVDNYLCGK